ncbi:MAG: laccase domain-containing protein [Candidatus Pacebacteria bacterium]|nr:laccase domain-containing protein [Candidatus Paceibacterota bacterium]
MSQSAPLQKEHVVKTIKVCGPALVGCFGILGGQDWKLDRTNPNGFDHILNVLPDEVQRLWMPVPTKADATIALSPEFKKEVQKDGKTVMGKCFADGVFIPKGEAFAITSADCPTVAMYDRKERHMLCFHAGRDSLFDRSVLLSGISGTPSREHFSVVHNALSLFRELGVLPEDIFMNLFCGIRTGFQHQRHHFMYGEYNSSLLNWCRRYEGALVNENITDEIDLHAIVRGQAIECGVPSQHIHFDGIDTYHDTWTGRHLWASARSDPRKKKRNLVLVHHR